MNHLARTLTAASAGLFLMAGLGACGQPSAAPAAPPSPDGVASSSPTPPATDQPPAPLPDRAPGNAAQTSDPAPVHPLDVLTDGMTGQGGRDRLRQLFLADQPAGTGPEIALRFLQALQDRDDFRAASELYIAGRTLLAQHDTAFLQQVMRDVAANARLDDAGPCTTAEGLTTETAVVRCGQQNVVVHVLDGPYGSGVQISDRHPSVDSYAAPHTHAFTTIEL